jgi:hypothetical protein
MCFVPVCHAGRTLMFLLLHLLQRIREAKIEYARCGGFA